MKKKLLFILKVFLTLAVTCVVFNQSVNMEDLREQTVIRPFWLPVIVICHLLVRWMQALQIRHSLHFFHDTPRIADIFGAQLISSFYTLILPGDAVAGGVTWHLLSRESGLRAETAAVLAFTRFNSLLTLVPLVLFGSLLDPRFSDLKVTPLIMITGVFILFLNLPFFNSALARKLNTATNAVLQLRIFNGFQKPANNLWNAINVINMLSWKPLLMNTAIAFLTNIAGAIMIWVCLLAVGIDIPVWSALWIRPLLVLVHLLPLTLAGLGVREFTLIHVLSITHHVQTSSSLILSLIIFLNMIIFSGLAGGFMIIFQKRHK